MAAPREAGGVTVQAAHACAHVDVDPFQVQVSPAACSPLTPLPLPEPVMPPKSTAPPTPALVAEAPAAKSRAVSPAGGLPCEDQVHAPVLAFTVSVQVSLSRFRQLPLQPEVPGVASSPPNRTSVLCVPSWAS